jgi:formylglycine-generating enzyme required for sulfatase activity
MPAIFISYRREDSIAYSGRLYDRLITEFGKDQVFMDIDSIDPGADFIEEIERTVAACDAVLVVIGRQWLTVVDAQGRRRIENPADFVHLEVGTALSRKVRVVPVLVGGAQMPRSDELPEALAGLSRRHALDLPDTAFHQTLGRLIDSLRKDEAKVREQADQELLANEAKVREQAKQERLAREAKAWEQALWEQAERERLVREAKAREQAEQERLAREAKAREQAERERLAREAKARDQAERERLAREAKAREQAEQERLAREAKAQEQPKQGSLAHEAKARGGKPGWVLGAVAVTLGLAALVAIRHSGPATTETTLKDSEKKVNPNDGLTYIWIRPGEFTMGCSPDDSECLDNEKPPHQVTITAGFWMGQTPVIQRAYQRVLGAPPSTFKGGQLPVETVSWDEAKNYCQTAGMRLPTEAEWEYAARAGTTTSRYGDIDQIAWYKANSGGKTHEVAQKQPNAWGLYDMLGNVSQWTADLYTDKYSGNSETDPHGPKNGLFPTLRGGSWGFEPGAVRVSLRGGTGNAVRVSFIGFRCAGN